MDTPSPERLIGFMTPQQYAELEVKIQEEKEKNLEHAIKVRSNK